MTAASGEAEPWPREAFEARLRDMERFYHIHHPFHIAMNEGGLDADAVRGWVANRFYYQIQIPRKDAAILANCPDRDIRREWIQRILDHDGRQGWTPGSARDFADLGQREVLSAVVCHAPGADTPVLGVIGASTARRRTGACWDVRTCSRKYRPCDRASAV